MKVLGHHGVLQRNGIDDWRNSKGMGWMKVIGKYSASDKLTAEKVIGTCSASTRFVED